MHQPVGRIGDPVHRVGGSTAGPQHVGCVEHDGQWSGHVGAAQSARPDGSRLSPGSQHLVDRGLLEAVEQFADGFVDPGDTCNRGGAGDDAHLVGVVAGVLRLPQRVTAPPTPHILVDDRHEVDRLTQRLAQADEERHIGGMQHNGFGVGVAANERGDGLFRAFQQRRVVEQRLDGAVVLKVQPRLGPLQHLLEPVAPGVGQPGAAG